jgi:hypothetical protein
MAPKNLQDLLKYNIDDLSEYEDVCKVISNVDIANESDEASIKKGFNVAKTLALKLHKENKLTLDLFEEETEKALKRG